MKTKDVIERVKTGVEDVVALNGMQEAMASDESRRVMLIAPTGSGKTLAFVIRLLRNMDAGVPGVKGVVIAPTRELVIQIADVVRKVAAGMRVTALYGGRSTEDERNSLAVTPDIVVATPGRLLDHLQRGSVDISGARSLVLDEFDKSLQLGFQDQMRRIVKRLRRLTLVVLTSATMMPELPDFAGTVADYRLYDYSDRVESPSGRTEYYEVVSPSRDKLVTLVRLLRSLPDGRVIVFVNYRDAAERVAQRLVKEGLPAGLYHGALDQQQRRVALEMFANGTTPVLVSTDLGSRGLDLPAVEAVVHYHAPVDDETRTHRNGRTARQGATGRVYEIIESGDGDDRADGESEISEESEKSDRSDWPEGSAVTVIAEDELRPSADPIRSDWATLYINAGKREKISRGDVAGYVMKQGGLQRDEVGRIMVDDHYALVAVRRDRASEVLERLAGVKVKGVTVRVSLASSIGGA